MSSSSSSGRAEAVGPGTACRSAAVLLATLVALLAVDGPGAFAYEIKAFADGTRKATAADYTPSLDREENRSNKFYAEQYSFAFKPDDGYGFWFQIVLTNMGVANGRAALRVDFTPKGEKEILTKAAFTREEWSYSVEGDQVTLKLGENTFSGDGMTWKGHFVNDRFTADCVIRNGMPATRPGGGAVYYGPGKKSYYDSTLLTPRGTFEATIVMKEGGETHQITGLAFGDNSVTNLAPNLQATSWIRLRSIGKQNTVSITLLKTSEEYEGRWVGYFFVASDKKMVACGSNPAVETAEFEKDKGSGYDIPKIALFSEAQGIDGFSGAIKAGKLEKRLDRLEALGSVERAVVSKLVQPVVFTYKAEFEFQLKDGSGKERNFKGKASYNFEQTTK